MWSELSLLLPVLWPVFVTCIPMEYHLRHMSWLSLTNQILLWDQTLCVKWLHLVLNEAVAKALSVWLPRDGDKKDPGLDTGHKAALASSSERSCEQWCPNSPGTGSDTWRGRGMAWEGRMLPRAQQEGPRTDTSERKSKNHSWRNSWPCAALQGYTRHGFTTNSWMTEKANTI